MYGGEEVSDSKLLMVVFRSTLINDPNSPDIPTNTATSTKPDNAITAKSLLIGA